MNKDLYQIVSLIISKSEQIEEEARLDSDLCLLTMKQLGVIGMIKELENPTLSEIAKKMGVTRPSASALLDKLNEKEYIVKVKSDTDRRYTHIHLTQKGEAIFNMHEEIHKSFARKLTEKLTESEKDILLVLLNKTIESI